MEKASSGFLLIIAGPTASGKNTILKKLLELHPSFYRIITTTTRSPRPGEKNKVDYYFIRQENFQKKLQKEDFLEYVEYSGNFYGTTKDEIKPVLNGKQVIWVVDPSMAAQAKAFFKKNLYPDGEKIAQKTIVIFIDVPDKQTLHQRFLKRGMTEAEIQKRLAVDWENEQKWRKKFEHIIVNKEGELSCAISEIEKLIKPFITRS